MHYFTLNLFQYLTSKFNVYGFVHRNNLLRNSN